jgi:hypothetical protein
MRESSTWTRAVHALVAGLALAIVMVNPAAAYVGPGAGLTAVGAILAVIATLFLAVVGFVWYPVKRLLRNQTSAGRPKSRKRAAQATPGD